MKTLIVSINSKYVHASLAPWYLKAACGDGCGVVKVKEFTINDRIDTVLADVYKEKADVIAFSCYIWNVDLTLHLVENLKQVAKDVKIVLGGPEASFDTLKLMQKAPAVDYVIAGEGEDSFKLLLEYLAGKKADIQGVHGLVYRHGETVVSKGPPVQIQDLDALPSPYTPEMLEGLQNKIVYFESSRGCPFSCSYCISSTFEGVRYFSLERVKRDLKTLAESGVRQIKFVDRTFNCHKQRAKEIFRYIIENFQGVNFHFEAAGDLFDDEMIEILSSASPGLIQFEVGVQTVNEKTYEEIGRKTDVRKVFEYTARIGALGNIHLHLDLIAGLPYEDFQSFQHSFNEVYQQKPHQFQLGFLKMLKGSRIREEASQHEYKFREYPPYEVLANQYISFDEILVVKEVEELVERYYNSGRFQTVLPWIIQHFFTSPFEFYLSFYRYNENMEYTKHPVSSRFLYTILLGFMMDKFPEYGRVVHELLKFDYLSTHNTNNLPEGIGRQYSQGFKEACFEFLKNEDHVAKYLEGQKGVPAKQIFKSVYFECFEYDVTRQREDKQWEEGKTTILFDYTRKNPVTGCYKAYKIELEDQKDG